MVMSWLRALENRLAGWWESLGRRSVGASLQPVEIAKKLLKEMSAHKKVSVRRVYVPNRYMVYLSPTDWNSLSAMEQALTEEWSQYLEEKALERGYSLVGRPVVRIEVDENLRAGQLQIHSRFSEDERSEPTRHFQPWRKLTLRVLRGPDSGLAYSFDQKEAEIHIGRRSTCQVVLRDLNVSRQHAVIERRSDTFWINDLGSVNGTWVNGKPVERHMLQSGDRIRVGDTEMEVELTQG
jgi:hypothetical protein